jgi:hypothetical protein
MQPFGSSMTPYSQKQSLGQILNRTYRNIRVPSAYILFLATFVLRFFPNEKVRLAIFYFLGWFILSILFEIHALIKGKEEIRVYENFTEASTIVRDHITRILAQKKSIKIDWIGVALDYDWPFLRGILQNYLIDDNFSGVVKLQLTLIDSSTQSLDHLSPNILRVAESQYQSIANFLEQFSQEMKAKQWEIQVYRYHHIPNLHGVLINDQDLFVGLCYWRKGLLRSGESSYEHFVRGDRFRGTEKIEQFVSWLEFCKKGHNVRRHCLG